MTRVSKTRKIIDTIFLDIQKAYDHVNIGALLHQLQQVYTYMDYY
jgi:hypothetical protein